MVLMMEQECTDRQWSFLIIDSLQIQIHICLQGCDAASDSELYAIGRKRRHDLPIPSIPSHILDGHIIGGDPGKSSRLVHFCTFALVSCDILCSSLLLVICQSKRYFGRDQFIEVPEDHQSDALLTHTVPQEMCRCIMAI